MREWEAKVLTYRMIFIASLIIAAICLIMDNMDKIKNLF